MAMVKIVSPLQSSCGSAMTVLNQTMLALLMSNTLAKDLDLVSIILGSSKWWLYFQKIII